jgi:hypothetical protein
MKTFFAWSVTAAAVTAGVVLIYEAWTAARAGMEQGLERAEAIASHTRAALEETERALRDTRKAIS